MAIVHAKTRHEEHSVAPRLVQQYLERHDPLVHHRYEATVLRAGVVLEVVGAEVHRPPGVVHLLNDDIGAVYRHTVDDATQFICRCRMRGDERPRVPAIDIVVGRARRIADADNLPLI